MSINRRGELPAHLLGMFPGGREEIRARARREWLRRESPPEEIRDGVLLLSERQLKCELPVPLSGRVDQVYACGPDRILVPVDTKRRGRARVEAEDIVQLSVYATLLRNSLMNVEVANRGYVRWVGPREVVRYLPARLLDDAGVARIYFRWLDLMEGRATKVTFRPSNRNCRQCVGRSKCKRNVAG